MTSALTRAALMCCSTSVKLAAQRWIRVQMVPSLIWTPNRSPLTSAARARGNNCGSHQIHRHRSNRWAILDGSSHVLGKTGRGDVLAHGTLFVFHPIFLHELTSGGTSWTCRR